MAAIGNTRRDAEPHIVTVEQLAAAKDPVIVDVRSPEEFREGHIEGAVLIPLDELESRLSDVPKGDPVYVVCHLGRRSAKGADILLNHGIDAKSLDGGMSAWESAGQPVVSDSRPHDS